MLNNNKHTLIFEVSKVCQDGSCGHPCDHGLFDQLEFKPGETMPDLVHDGCMCMFRPKTYRGKRVNQSRVLQSKIEELRRQLSHVEMTNQKRRHIEHLLSELVDKAERSHQVARCNQKRQNRKTWF